MTLEEHADNLKKLANAANEKAIESVVIPASNELLANIKNRVFRDGLNSNGQKIGSYSTKPIYVERQEFVVKSAFKGIGKTGKTNNKTMYLSQGYKEFRQIQGRQAQYVDEFLSGSLSASYQMQAKKNEVLLGLTTEKSAKIRRGQQAKFGKIFSATNEEIQEFNKTVAKGTGDLTVKILSGAAI